LLKNNYIKNSTVSNLWYASNGVSLITDAFSRPEVRFGTDIRYRGNISEELDNIIMPINCPVVDLTQEWQTSASEALKENFTGYRFHVNPGNARADSKILAVSAGASKNIYNWFFFSNTSHTVSNAITSLTFTVTSAQNITSSLFNSWASDPTLLPIGTFVRGEVSGVLQPTEYFEGRVTGFTAGTNTFSFTCSVVYNTVATGVQNAWKFYFDQDALYVSKTGDLVLRNNIAADKTTGTKIGINGQDKLSFWGVDPVTRPAKIDDAISTNAHTQLNLLLETLRTIGIIRRL
jgi:hypothetical protein